MLSCFQSTFTVASVIINSLLHILSYLTMIDKNHCKFHHDYLNRQGLLQKYKQKLNRVGVYRSLHLNSHSGFCFTWKSVWPNMTHTFPHVQLLTFCHSVSGYKTVLSAQYKFPPPPPYLSVADLVMCSLAGVVSAVTHQCTKWKKIYSPCIIFLLSTLMIYIAIFSHSKIWEN